MNQVQFSRSVTSDSLRPHGLQHSRLPCPSPTPGVYTNPCPSSQGYVFSSSPVWMLELDCKESWVLKKWWFWTVVLEKTLESVLDCKKIKLVNPKWISREWCWSWNSNTLVTWYEELTHWKRPSCWERLKAGGEGDDRGWDSWMATLTRWTWAWASSRSRWWTGKPGVLQSTGSQRVWHDWATELMSNLLSIANKYLENRTNLSLSFFFFFLK